MTSTTELVAAFERRKKEADEAEAKIDADIAAKRKALLEFEEKTKEEIAEIKSRKGKAKHAFSIARYELLRSLGAAAGRPPGEKPPQPGGRPSKDSVPADLSPTQKRIMRMLHRKPMTNTQITDACGIPRGSITYMLNGLVERGLIARMGESSFDPWAPLSQMPAAPDVARRPGRPMGPVGEAVLQAMRKAKSATVKEMAKAIGRTRSDSGSAMRALTRRGVLTQATKGGPYTLVDEDTVAQVVGRAKYSPLRGLIAQTLQGSPLSVSEVVAIVTKSGKYTANSVKKMLKDEARAGNLARVSTGIYSLPGVQGELPMGDGEDGKK